MQFTDRRDAGRQLAATLDGRVDDAPAVVALPRGGVPVAAEVAAAMDVPLDVIGVRKVGAPGQPELGVGAVAEGGALYLDEASMRHLGLGRDDLAGTIEAERAELRRRVGRYRGERPLEDVSGRTVVVVDDGLATGVTARVAAQTLRDRGAAHVVMAVPVCSREGRAAVAAVADDVVCVRTPEPFQAVGVWYADFSQTTDEEVLDVLSSQPVGPVDGAAATTAPRSAHVRIPVGGAIELEGDLVIPPAASGLVVFAHGSGSSRHSPRNAEVARALQDAGLGTLLLDLLTDAEEQADARTGELRFDIDLLADRLVGVTGWLAADEATRRLRVALFGASTGAGAALVAAARVPDRLGALVSRGGRPDLAGDALEQVALPVLLVVGGADRQVLELNRRAAARIPGDVELEVVPDASHLFEEPGALERVAELAAGFLTRHLPPTGGAR